MGTGQLTTKSGRSPGYYIYGRRVVREFIRSKTANKSIKKLHIQNNLPHDLLHLLQSNFTKVPVQQYPLGQMQEAFDFHHQGVILEFDKQNYPGFSTLNWKEFLKSQPGPYVALDRITDAQNLGNIIRTSEALGATAVVCCGPGCPINETAHRVSAGVSLHIPIFFVQNLQQFINHAKQHNYWICASASRSDLNTSSLTQKNMPLCIDHNQKDKLPAKENAILLIGSEGEGLKKSAQLNSDFMVSIDLKGQAGSLNAAVAAAILLDRIIN